MYLTDYYLDEFANTSISGSPPTRRALLYEMFRYLILGTGTGTPAVTDTTMFNEYVRTDTTFVEDTDDSVVDTTNNLLIFDVTESFVWTNTTGSGVAFTEIGFSKANTGAISAHDLLRSDPTNPASSAITLNVDDGEQVQVYLNRTFEIPFPVLTTEEIIIGNGSGGFGVAGKTGVGDVDVQKGIYFASSATSIGNFLRDFLFWSNNTAHTTTNIFWYYDNTPDSITRNAGFSQNSGILQATRTWSAYSAGSKTRELEITIGTGTGNATWNAMLFGSSTYGFLIDFINPAGIEKTTLIQTKVYLDVSWDRA